MTSLSFRTKRRAQFLRDTAKARCLKSTRAASARKASGLYASLSKRAARSSVLNRASSFAIEQFKLPVRDITEGLKRTEFYAPGSILRMELDTTHAIARGMPKESVAWVENSPVFEISDQKEAARVHLIARYPVNSDPLLSGWLLGGERLRGKAALVEVKMGRGRVVLFGFRPQYRGQSMATYPLFFNSFTKQSGSEFEFKKSGTERDDKIDRIQCKIQGYPVHPSEKRNNPRRISV